jgi:CRISPR-associated protein Cas5t
MNELDVLRLKFSAPTAHFRIIHSNNPRRTYQVPPYSAIIGLIANILGEQATIEKLLETPFYLGVAAKHEFTSHDYTWMRNMDKSAHQNRFASVQNRSWQENIEHPGGQSPVIFEVLNNFELGIYLMHSDKTITERLINNAFQSDRWISHLHLGRSEDWAMIEEVKEMVLGVAKTSSEIKNAADFYQWMPHKDYCFYDSGKPAGEQEYEQIYNKTQGTVALVTTIYRTIEAPGTDNRTVQIRNFEHLPAKIVKSQVPLLDSFKLPTVFADSDLRTPIYLAKIAGKGR